MSLENASCGSEHKCFGALDAPFIGYQHNAVLITCLYVSDYKIVGRALKWAQYNARGGAHDPGKQVYCTYIIFIDNGFILLRLGGARNTFSLDMGALQKYLYFAIVTLSIHFSYYALQYVKVICINIKCGCSHLGVATIAIHHFHGPCNRGLGRDLG